jgi:hypothetical protein
MYGESTGNYQLMEEESTGRMVILPGITSSRREIFWKRVILPGMNSS